MRRIPFEDAILAKESNDVLLVERGNIENARFEEVDDWIRTIQDFEDGEEVYEDLEFEQIEMSPAKARRILKKAYKRERDIILDDREQVRMWQQVDEYRKDDEDEYIDNEEEDDLPKYTPGEERYWLWYMRADRTIIGVWHSR